MLKKSTSFILARLRFKNYGKLFKAIALNLYMFYYPDEFSN